MLSSAGVKVFNSSFERFARQGEVLRSTGVLSRQIKDGEGRSDGRLRASIGIISICGANFPDHEDSQIRLF